MDRTNKDGQKEPVIIVHMLKIQGVSSFPSPRLQNSVSYIISTLSQIVQHELQHLVQFILLQSKDKSQIAMLPDYKNYGDDYYASQCERDPQISDSVKSFLRHWKLLNQYRKISLKKSILQVVGMTPAAFANGFSADPVFKALKKIDPIGYKKAVKNSL